jgi:hypothetical protein
MKVASGLPVSGAQAACAWDFECAHASLMGQVTKVRAGFFAIFSCKLLIVMNLKSRFCYFVLL